MSSFWVRVVFMIAAIYDGGLGLAFLFFGSDIFRIANVTPPNDLGYIQFPALLLVVFAVMFFHISRNPPKHRELMLYGAGLKASYVGVVQLDGRIGGHIVVSVADRRMWKKSEIAPILGGSWQIAVGQKRRYNQVPIP